MKIVPYLKFARDRALLIQYHYLARKLNRKTFSVSIKYPSPFVARNQKIKIIHSDLFYTYLFYLNVNGMLMIENSITCNKKNFKGSIRNRYMDFSSGYQEALRLFRSSLKR